MRALSLWSPSSHHSATPRRIRRSFPSPRTWTLTSALRSRACGTCWTSCPRSNDISRTRFPPERIMISRKRVSVAATCILLSALTAAAQDPRIGLGGGFQNAQSAIRNLELVGHGDKPENMYNPQNLGDFGFLNSDLAFQGNTLFQGSFNGMQFWDISDVSKPTLKLAFPCPGGQGDPSIYGHLLFMSVEEPRGRVDCGAGGVPDSVSKDRFRGVRIFDVTDMAHPKQVAAVQTCRGSHTHTLAV